MQVIHIDNLDEGSSYGGGVLDSALTSSLPGDRMLGSNKTPEGIELRTLWNLSGNNISPWKDAYRRWLVCNLKTLLEVPEERPDLEHEMILRYAIEHRPEFVRDALIILKAHALGGRPKGPWSGRLGSFEAWDIVVRGAVWFALGVDPYATQRTASKETPERQRKVALLQAWARHPSGFGPHASGMTANAMLKIAASEPDKIEGLHDALIEFGKDGKLPSPVSLSCTLRALEGNPLSGMMFAKSGAAHNIVSWKVVQTNSTATSGGVGGVGGVDPALWRRHFVHV